MKKRSTLPLLLGFLLLGLGVLLAWFIFPSRHHPSHLIRWVQTSGQRDWSAQAAQGDAAAQFYLGLTLIRTNLVIARDRVPGLANLPIIGRHFQHTSADLDMNTDPDLMREAFQWIKKSAEQGHAPARATEKLFAHKIAELERMDETDAPPR